MSAPFADRLIEAVRSKGAPLCLGVDPYAERIPSLFGDARTDVRAVQAFSEALIACAAPHVACVKIQLALFEPYGPEGYGAARALVGFARALGLCVILDAKRGDIGATAEGYARASLGPAPGFDADCVTVSPYMGADSLEPFLAHAEQNAKGVAVLVRTSNPGGADLQNIDASGAPVWAHVARLVAPHCPRLAGASGWSGLMAVAGATTPAEARALRGLLPSALFLIPGYGAQGASAADAIASFVPGPAGLEGGVVNSSRAIAYPPAAMSATNLSAWRSAVAAAVEHAHAELRQTCLI